MCDLLARFTEEARRFVQDYAEYKEECSIKEAEEPSCGHDKWTRWDCCIMHKQLNARSMRLMERAVVLDAVFGIGGVTKGHSLSALRDVPYDKPSAGHSVGSFGWFISLAHDAGLDQQTVEFAKYTK